MTNKHNPDDIHVVVLNRALIERQGVSPEHVEAIKAVTIQLNCLLKHPNSYGEPKHVARLIESYEYVLQGLWNFEQNPDYHTYWNKVEGCTCPQMDNEGMMGTGMRWKNDECPFHGNINENLEE